MATSTINNYIGNGTTDSFLIGFDYLRKSFVEVFLDDLLQELGIDYEFSTDNVITFSTAPANGVSIVIMRNTIIDETIVDYIDPAILSANDLNRSFKQPLHLLQEMQDDITELNINHDIYGNIDLGGTRIINSGQPINDNDLATKKYVDDNDDALRTFIESVDSDLLDLSNNVDNKIEQTTNTFSTQINNLETIVDNNNTIITESLDSHVYNLQNQIDAIDIAGVKISSEADNAIAAKSDGLFVPDLSTDVDDLLDKVQALDDDSTAQWVKINDTLNRVATNTSNISENHNKISANTIDIIELDERVYELENNPSGGGFNTVCGGFNTVQTVISSSVIAAPVSGWYKITLIGGGAGGGSGGYNSNPNYGGGSAGGGMSGMVKIWYEKIAAGSLLIATVGAGGSGGSNGGSGSIGGISSFKVDNNAAISNDTHAAPGIGVGGETGTVHNGVGGSYSGVGVFGNGFNGTGGSGQYGYACVGGNGGSNGTAYGGGGGGGGGGYSGTGTNYRGGFGGLGGSGNAKAGGRGTYGTTQSTGGYGGKGADGAVILEYFDPNL